MKKYIKFILPIILVVLVVIVILLSVVLKQPYNSSTNNNNNNDNSSNNQIIKIEFSELYDMIWFLESANLYKNGELIFEVPLFNDDYIIFEKDILKHCLSFEDKECKNINIHTKMEK